MVITHIMGGIGNQLFQYAAGRCLAYKNITALKLDIIQCEAEKETHHNYYRLGEFNVQENFATLEEIQSLSRFDENDYKTIGEFFNAPDNILLYDYWQNEKYFIEIRDILLNEMTLKNPLGKNSSAWKEKILNSDCAVSLHLRCGDYLTPLSRNDLSIQIPVDYYFDSINELRTDFSNITVFVFSDDLDCAKQILKFDVPTEFVEDCETDAEELYLMSICKHNIISRSTFAWWGAWLNQNPDKKVFMPDSYIQMKNSVSIKIKENARPILEFPPMLSIIVYVENNLSTINFSLSSMFSQNLADYEIILVDTSTDGSSEICRSVVANKKVTLLTMNHSTKKFSAWNKALKVARGDYILFLTAKEFLLSTTVKSLAQFQYDYLKQYVEPRGEYLYFSNYGEIYPNIICSTQKLEENEQGEFTIDGITNKKFSLKIDSALSNLDGIAELKIPEKQKLMLLASEQINNSLGTKFFKRKFLIDKKIKFSGVDKENGEILFIAEAFLQTEKITFIPDIFYGRFK